ncbi:MAG: magnesium transporter CorA family protein [Planctomycetota bacterium]
MQKKYCVVNGKLRENDGGPCSVTVFSKPTEEEKRHILEDLKIDEHNLTSSLDPDELSRVEFDPEHVVAIYSVPKNYSAADEFLFKGGTVGAFLFKDRLVVITTEDPVIFETINVGRASTHTALLLKLILAAIIHFRGHLKVVAAIADEVQEKINRAMENRYLIHLFTIEKSLVYYLNFIHSNGLLLEKMKNNAARIGLTPEDMEALDDIIIENAQCLKQAEIHSNIIASLMDARASIVANNLNVIMRNLMIITLAVMVPSLVVALFSMNVPLPLPEHIVAFWIVAGMATVSAVAVLAYWLRKWRT